MTTTNTNDGHGVPSLKAKAARGAQALVAAATEHAGESVATDVRNACAVITLAGERYDSKAAARATLDDPAYKVVRGVLDAMSVLMFQRNLPTAVFGVAPVDVAGAREAATFLTKFADTADLLSWETAPAIGTVAREMGTIVDRCATTNLPKAGPRGSQRAGVTRASTNGGVRFPKAARLAFREAGATTWGAPGTAGDVKSNLTKALGDASTRVGDVAHLLTGPWQTLRGGGVGTVVTIPAWDGPESSGRSFEVTWVEGE